MNAPHLTDQRTTGQGRKGTCPELHSEAELGLGPRTWYFLPTPATAGCSLLHQPLICL